ncbi:cation:proton antiporter [Corynebacterium phocae]|uniref:Cation:proton antiporter n=1 Tax=Corynebacterium phocae TaxID=161895 RepID=A0A1L7D5T6_9CORY|nr:Na+/H+ antiporter subunit E [Corynebacterium phocae]APT93302.1 cation:proton antiporter [Corynebacterium phocae]KAA8721631.1 Na+/H+ antiporter subunit E [Corynebacterium phocae]
MSNPSLASRVRGRFRPVNLAWLVVMWVLLMGELSWANVIGGLVVGILATVLLPLPAMPLSDMHISWGKLLVFLGTFAFDFLVASVRVSWLALRPSGPPRTAIVNVPLRVDSEFVLTAAVLLYNLEPGGTVTDIDIANRTLTVHLLNADSEADIAREIRAIAKLERTMIDIFERTTR